MADDSAVRKVLLPVDGSEHSQRAFDWYLRNIRRPGDEVVVVHSPELPHLPMAPYPSSDGSYMFYKDAYEQAQQTEVKAGEILKQFEEKCKENNLPCKTVRETGIPGHVICKKADEEKASCIVMGNRGLNLIRRTLLGSVSNYVINHSSATVTVVPPAHDEQK